MTAQQAWLGAEDVDHADVHVPGDGPHDVEDLDPEVTLAAGTVDFGAVRVPVPEHGTVTVEPTDKGRMQAVHVSVPEGRLSVSALAAPKSSRLWPDLVKEIDSSLRDGGARVRSFQGDWGRELHATSGAATSRFVGVDGARWMLYGVATGPTRDADALDEQLRRMLRGTIVVRGRSPYPVRTVLPLEVPEHLAATPPPAAVAEPAVAEAAVPEQPATTALPTVAPVDRTPPTTALPVSVAASAPGRPPHDTLPPTTAIPLVGRTSAPQPVSAVPTEALPVWRADGASVWPDRVARTAAPGRPVPVDRGPDPDDRPTEIRPGRLLPVRDDLPPTERWAAPRVLGDGPASRPEQVETGPWPPDRQPSTGGRRRLREADPATPEGAPAAGRRRAPEPEPYTGRRRAPEPPAGRRRLPDPPVAPPPPAGRRPIDSHASPAAGRRRAPDGPNSTVAIPVYDVLRPGRHAAAGPAPAPDRGAETQPWTAFRPAEAETAPWVVTAPDRGPGGATQPLPRAEPVAPVRPTGRHHRVD